MVDTPRVIGVNNFNSLAFTFVCVSAVEFGHAKSFRDVRPLHGSITVNAHGPDVNEVTLLIVFHHGDQDVLGGLGVVGVGLID